MTIYINGKSSEADFPTLADAVASVSSAKTGIAAAVDDVVIPKSQWANTQLNPGARIEIVTAVQGG